MLGSEGDERARALLVLEVLVVAASCSPGFELGTLVVNEAADALAGWSSST